MYDSRLIWREPVLTHAISACTGGFGELGEYNAYSRTLIEYLRSSVNNIMFIM